MCTPSTIAIVGASLAGARAVESLRANGYGERVVLIGAEEHPPYERPPLSKGVLIGNQTPESTQIRASWDELDVDLVLGDAVVEVSASEAALTLASGSCVKADQVLIATGGRSIDLALPGSELSGIFSLRDLDDALRLRTQLLPGANVVVVGGGFIGLEVAASAHELGCEVTVIEAATVPLARRLGPSWGAFIAEQHIARGVRIGAGVGVSGFVGDTSVGGVLLDDGTELPADVVVVGVGMHPRTELAKKLGLEVAHGGIVVDGSGRTSNPAIFAAGDVTVQPAWRREGLERFESYQNAQEQAFAAASTMLGRPVAQRDVPWFWSDQFDMNIQVAGELRGAHEIVVRGDIVRSSFIAFCVAGRQVQGVIAVNRGKDVRGAVALIQARVPVEPEALADETTDLRRLARAVSAR